MKEAVKFKTVDQYIAEFPTDMRKMLAEMRATIKAAAPDAEEMISYNMPGYKLNGRPLVYFAGNKNHIGFYPTPSPIKAFEKDIKHYKSSKGAIQFPLDGQLPLKLVEKIVKFKVKENRELTKIKESKKK